MSSIDNNSEQENIVIKLNKEEKPFYAKICFNSTKNNSNLFSIQVFSDDRSWTGRLSYEEAESFADHIHEDIDEYSRNVRDAFKRNNNSFKFEFTNEESGKIPKFTWKRTFADSTVTLVHGFVTLQCDEVLRSKNNIIDFLLDTNTELLNRIKDIEENNKLLNSTVDKCNSEIEKFINIKDSIESNLYGKFVQILNSKKRRIALLKDHIASIESVDD